MVKTAQEIYRDYETDGVPSSGVHNPRKAEIREWGTWLENVVAAGGIADAVWKATKSALDADLAHAADTVGVVYADSTAANNGLYVKSGASGAGSWSQILDYLPGYQVVVASADEGASTANAIVADTAPMLPASDGVALVILNIPVTNTSGTVTVAFDGGTAMQIKTASGNNPAVGGLAAGMMVIGTVQSSGTVFRILSDQTSAAIQAAAEAAQVAAEEARDDAEAAATIATTASAVFDTIADLAARNFATPPDSAIVNGYAAAGDGGGALYKKVVSEPSHAGKVQSADGTWFEIAEEVISLKAFGATGDGVTDDTDAVQDAFDYCASAAKPWLQPAGQYAVTETTCWTAGRCFGEFISSNNSALGPVLTIASLAADTEVLDETDISGWGDFEAGQKKIAAATNLKGWMYQIGSDQVWINRTSTGAVEKGHVFDFVTDAGHISKPFRVDITNSGTFGITRKRIREMISVDDVRVTIQGGAGGRAAIVSVQRPSTKVSRGYVLNESGEEILEGFQTYIATNVEFDNCVVEGLEAVATNYGFHAIYSSDVVLNNCHERNCRRGVDAKNADGVTINGGSFPSGIGAHWGFGFTVTDAEIGSTEASANPNPVQYSGGDLDIRSSEIVLGNNGEFVNMREDYPEISGYVRLVDNTYTLDNSGGAITATSVHLLDLRASGTTSAYDAGRALVSPREITIRGGEVRFRGGGFNSAIRLSLIEQSGSLASVVASAFVFDCRAIIEGLRFDWGALTALDGSSVPRASLVINKPHSVSGAGYRVMVRDIDCLFAFASADSAHVDSPEKRSAARLNLIAEDVPTLYYSLSNGCWRTAFARNFGSYTRTTPGGTSGFTAVGDEHERAHGYPSILPQYTVATVPSAATYVKGMIYVTDDVGGGIVAFSDGTNWRRVTDRAIVSTT